MNDYFLKLGNEIRKKNLDKDKFYDIEGYYEQIRRQRYIHKKCKQIKKEYDEEIKKNNSEYILIKKENRL